MSLGSAVAFGHQLVAGHTSARYGMGFEWFPNEEKSVRLHIYGCRMTDSYTDANTNEVVSNASWNINLGATWTMDFRKLF